MTGDLLRYALASGALLLCLTSTPGILWADQGFDQRLRFATTLGYGLVTTGGQLSALGRPPTFWTWLLVPVTVLALAGTVGFLVKRAPVVLSGGGDSEDR